MLQIGKSITSADDPLMKLQVVDLYNMIKNPSSELKQKIQQLRIILTIDQNKYRQLKTALPYFTCGIFNPPFRKTENFGFAEHFVLDIDHLREKEIDIIELKNKLQSDTRVEMIFVSPGSDGLKILFRLSERCFDHAKFSIFYKLFANQFSLQYNLNNVIDRRTSDVTRACFLSSDPDIIFRTNVDAVDISTLVNFENSQEVKEAVAIIKEDETKQIIQPEPFVSEKPIISPDILQEIKQKLNPKIKTQKDKIIFVPEKLDEIIGAVKQRTSEFDITVKLIENIHYGKKFVFELQNMWAEINVFYGKKGFSVVKTPKRGANAELTDIVFNILCEMFY